MIGNDGLARPQGKSRRRSQVNADAGHAHDAGIPADAGLDQEAVFLRDIAQNLAKLDPQPLAVRRTVSASKASKVAPCKAITPSSDKISCWRMRCSRARSVRSGGFPPAFLHHRVASSDTTHTPQTPSIKVIMGEQSTLQLYVSVSLLQGQNDSVAAPCLISACMALAPMMMTPSSRSACS